MLAGLSQAEAANLLEEVWSLAGVRLGFAVAPEWMVAELDTVVLTVRPE